MEAQTDRLTELRLRQQEKYHACMEMLAGMHTHMDQQPAALPQILDNSTVLGEMLLTVTEIAARSEAISTPILAQASTRGSEH